MDEEERAVAADEKAIELEEVEPFVSPVFPGDGKFLHWIVVIFGG